MTFIATCRMIWQATNGGSPMADPERWKEQLWKWIDDPGVRVATRLFLGGEGLSDAKIANWRRREFPDTFIEGAALAHCAGGGDFDVRAFEQTKLAGHEFWQVFIVSGDSDDRGNHGCSIMRLWTGTRRKSGVPHPIDFAHKTWFTGPSSTKHPPVRNIVGPQSLETIPIGKSKAFSVVWSVADSEPHDFGYRADVDATVATRFLQRNQKHEYLGGMSTIPVERGVLVASFPHSVLNPSHGLLITSPFS